MTVSLSYVGARDRRAGEDKVAVAQPAAAPSAPLRTAHQLVDQYLAMREATTAFHVKGDPKAAHALLSGLDARMASSGLAGLDEERKLTSSMLAQAALFSGYGGELPKSLRHIRTAGTWEIVGTSNIVDLRRGDRLEFTRDGELLTYRKAKGFDDADENESYEINERQLHMVNSRLVFDWRMNADGNSMTLKTADVGTPASIVLRRIPAT